MLRPREVEATVVLLWCAAFASCAPAPWPGPPQVVGRAEPPIPPLRTVHRIVLSTPGALRVGLIDLVSQADRTLVAWVEERAEPSAYWAELDDEGAPRWRHELPFVPARLGIVDGRAVFVRVDESGIHACVADQDQGADRIQCERVSPERSAQITFGPREIALDFGVAVVRYRPGHDIRPSIDLHQSEARSPFVPDRIRVGPCDETWVVLHDGDVRGLDGRSRARIDPASRIVVVGAHTIAIPQDGALAIDLCSGRRISLTRSSSAAAIVAAFIGARGLATVRMHRPDDGGSWYEYAYAARSEVHYQGDTDDASAPTVSAAHLDARGRLWLAVIRDDQLSIDVRAPTR